MLNVEIGGGNAPRMPKFAQVDIVKHACTTHVAPAWDLPFDTGTVDTIFTRHMLEHLYPVQAHATLDEWARVLCKGGQAIAIVPDLAYHARQLLDPTRMSSRIPDKTNLEHALAGFYGWAGGHMEHKWGYIGASLLDLFSRHGYVDCRLAEPASVGDLHIVARRG